MYVKDGPLAKVPVKVHVSFSQKEISRIDRKASSVGLTRTAYVRQMALEGKVKGYNLKPFLVHAEAIGEVVAAVRDMIAKEHPDRWAYEADIEKIQEQLQELIESEKNLDEKMTRRLKR